MLFVEVEDSMENPKLMRIPDLYNGKSDPAGANNFNVLLVSICCRYILTRSESHRATTTAGH